jgi:16S rRNA (adenine1518-N6/adenine1519-N6)-dimethyltransferase
MKNTFTAKKSLGQHFLRSEKALLQMKESLGNFDIENTMIFEIGPGEGMLTEKLLQTGAVVVVIEIDKRSIEFLQKRFEQEIEDKRLVILEKSCLEVDYSIEMRAAAGRAQKYILVGNTPYYIQGAKRIVARDKKESILSVSVKIFSDAVKIVDIVKAGSFVPPPKVDSAIISIDNIQNPFKNTEQQKKFFAILKSAFAHKRKFALSNIKSELGEELRNNLQKEIGEKERAEDIDVERWHKIINL